MSNLIEKTLTLSALLDVSGLELKTEIFNVELFYNSNHICSRMDADEDHWSRRSQETDPASVGQVPRPAFLRGDRGHLLEQDEAVPGLLRGQERLHLPEAGCCRRSLGGQRYWHVFPPSIEV